MTGAVPAPARPCNTRAVTPYAHVYQVTKYDPKDRGPDGCYLGPLDTENDDGPIEAAYVSAMRAFLLECGVDRMTVRNPEARLPGGDPDRTPLTAEHPLARLFGTRLEHWYDGTEISVDDAGEVVRWMLRSGVWCRLESGDAVAVHVGWDLYMSVCTDRPCPMAVDATARLGLFAEEMERSPHEHDDDLDTAGPADGGFWASVDALARERGAVCIVEEAAWPRHFTMAAGGARPILRPGARVAVWPQWTPAPARGLLATLSSVRRRLSRRQVEDIRVAEGLVWRGTFPPADLYEEPPALRAIVPGPDGTVSARWPAWVVET